EIGRAQGSLGVGGDAQAQAPGMARMRDREGGAVIGISENLRAQKLGEANALGPSLLRARDAAGEEHGLLRRFDEIERARDIRGGGLGGAGRLEACELVLLGPGTKLLLLQAAVERDEGRARRLGALQKRGAAKRIDRGADRMRLVIPFDEAA